MNDDWLRRNRENWDDRVPVHAASDFYDLAGFRAGADTLRPFEIDELGDVTGRSLLHLQCHMGQDTLSWARRGARVTGLDFSAPAVETARGLAADIGLADRARFVVADVHDAAEALGGERFDIVYTGIGALVWLPDVERWARVAASSVAEGGMLYLAEFHPFTEVLGDEGTAVVRDYFFTEGERFDHPHSYTGDGELAHTAQVQWHHTLGEIVTALARAGLVIELLNEHDYTLWARFPHLEQTPGRPGYRHPAGRPRVPLMFSIRARRPA
ncbi:class I SAM-dependent methyltransferase [Streptomyces radicis]|uniref:Class I SAM-dependent methyltransferase n=1 Tax=Streptomyces radicis TaxID=1750517 RepID=A0A3A9WCK3_9ACTN|nr:class I SAM-dependent methyltransferase [Streptomyces radicis]RKN05366.1 class I SAM-dependent methyltransferase [Streptomyces radicis]RKN16874.1 class I SAM-dependent methyltransferase [Streptomyces radicis]